MPTTFIDAAQFFVSQFAPTPFSSTETYVAPQAGHTPDSTDRCIHHHKATAFQMIFMWIFVILFFLLLVRTCAILCTCHELASENWIILFLLLVCPCPGSLLFLIAFMVYIVYFSSPACRERGLMANLFHGQQISRVGHLFQKLRPKKTAKRKSKPSLKTQNKIQTSKTGRVKK